MVRLFAIVAFATLPLCHLSADDAVPPDHSTVHIVFISPHDNLSFGMGSVDEDGKPVLMASTGSVVMPFDSFRPVSIEIDSKFVGHALFGYDKVSPVFILPSGQRKFSFSCQGFKPVTQDVYVLGTGSKQYLIVKMHPTDDDTAVPSVSSDATVLTPQDGK